MGAWGHLKNLLSEGRKRVPSNPAVKRFLVALSIILCLFELWLGYMGKLAPYQIGIIFLTPMLVVIFLTRTAGRHTQWEEVPCYDFILAGLSIVAGLYIMNGIDRWLEFIPKLDRLSSLDLIMGSILLLLVIEATRRTVGVGMTLIILVFMAYVLWGDVITGTFAHRKITWEDFVTRSVYTKDGIFGMPIQVAATYAFLFVLFGGAFARAGGGQFFFDLAASLTGTAKGGPAKIAVISSGLFGMISGSPVSDVVTTGSVTIPLMKRLGYSSIFAGAVETVASTGGSILPPIMGSAAFLMVEFTGIPYKEIVQAAIVPAILYYIVIYAQVHCRAENLNLVGLDPGKIPSIKATFKNGWYFIIPFAVLLWLIFQGFTPVYVAVLATAVTIAISWFNLEGKIGLKKIIEIFVTTVEQVAPLTGACAAAGLVISSLLLTGLGGKFGRLIFSVGEGQLLLSLIIAMVFVAILGMGMPTPSAYIIAAVVVGPVLQDLGVPTLLAHLFILYFACLAAITPPIATAAFAAAGIADANPIKIATQAVKLGIVAYIIPFIFIYQPEILLQGSAGNIILAVITGILGALFLAVGLEGLPSLAWWSRAGLIAAGALTIVPGLISDLLGIIIALFILLGSRIVRERLLYLLPDRSGKLNS